MIKVSKQSDCIIDVKLTKFYFISIKIKKITSPRNWDVFAYSQSAWLNEKIERGIKFWVRKVVGERAIFDDIMAHADYKERR